MLGALSNSLGDEVRANQNGGRLEEPWGLENTHGAAENLRLLARLGCVGSYGFFEALDYSRGNPELVRSWMSHHQGMSLLAAAEVLLGDRLKDAFHSEAQVRATERLLEERVPRTVVPDEASQPRVLWPEESAA